MIFRRDDEEFERSSLVGLLTSPFRAVGKFFSELLGSDDSFRSEQTIGQRVVSILTLPFRLSFAIGSFLVQSWSTSRNGYAFLKALPVLLVLSTFGVALLLADLISTESKRIGRNRGYIILHSNGSPEYCEMFAQKLIEIKPTQENIYELGLSRARVNDYFGASDVMRSIAPDDQPGYSLAHAWMAQYYSRDQTSGFNDEQRDRLVRQHLDYAVDVDPDNQLAQYSLGLYHLGESEKYEKGTPERIAACKDAMTSFERVVNSPNPGITRFQLYSIPKLLELKIEVQDNVGDLKTELAQEIIRLQPLADRYPDQTDIRFAMVRCAILIEDYQKAINIVREGFQLASNDTTKQKMIGFASLVYQERASKFRDMTDPDQFRGRVHTLCEAVRSNPSDKVVYLGLLNFIGTVPAEEGIINNDWLIESLSGAQTPAVIHCLLGLNEISSGDVLIGEKHWRIADQQFPQSQLIINNLMDIAATERPEQFKNILDMLTLAISMYPDQPLFYRTRGIYFASQGQYDNAIKDLAFASEKLPKILDIHKHLIHCYTELGDQARLESEQRALEDKLAELDVNQRERMEEVISKIRY